jgi:hypothetical protein
LGATRYVGSERHVTKENRHGYRGDDHQDYIHSGAIHDAHQSDNETFRWAEKAVADA